MVKTKYCSLHQDYGHTIENYHNFKYNIEIEVGKGNLNELIMGKAHTSNATDMVNNTLK